MSDTKSMMRNGFTSEKVQWTIDRLQEILSKGPVESKKIREMLSGHRIGEKTLKTAKEALDIHEYRRMKQWYWYINSAPPKVKAEEFDGTPIIVLHFPNRLDHILRRAGFSTVESLLQARKNNRFQKIRNVGPILQKMIEEALDRYDCESDKNAVDRDF